MNRVEASRLVLHLDADERVDLMMYLAEQFEYRVMSKSEDITYFLGTGIDKTDSKEERIRKLLNIHGYELICLQPFEICVASCPESMATGEAAEIILNMLEEKERV